MPPHAHIRLVELNSFVKKLIADNTQPQWITAEISEVNEHYSGHCYLELIEKDDADEHIIAKAKAVIWSFTYRMIKPYFETTTHERLMAGMKVLVKVEVSFHEAYGYSLVIKDIDPQYTLGDMARKRALIIQQLYAEGVMDLNKEIDLPLLVQRIAVISSPGAAGYTDFCNQLHGNAFGFVFYHRLFAAVMQGTETEASIINALEAVYEHKELFDVVVIIRGGGATSDLSWFDNYNIAYHCTQFPLPILSGIGHDKDVSVVDMVAHTSLKTPTAVAQFLVDCMQQTESNLHTVKEEIINYTEQALESWQQRLQLVTLQLPNAVKRKVEQAYYTLTSSIQHLQHRSKQNLTQKAYTLDKHQQYVQLVSPIRIFEKGYTLTLKNGKPIHNQTLAKGDVVETISLQKRMKSTIIEIENGK
ncbi:MAG TPA: exodeoxyribonuclease VII large subunit [Paludibacteraceae bacterium]|nr:exodeoxyribonuclease VII large subunit [Paludibacteraceae bacterium]HPL95067.1 exodeoxyribonuclease VII large subunit [Paludibacteraceae bacterium]